MKFSKSFYIIINLIFLVFLIFWLTNISTNSTLYLLKELFFGDWLSILFTFFLVLLILVMWFGFLFRDRFMNKTEIEEFNPDDYDDFFAMFKEAYSRERLFSPVKWKKRKSCKNANKKIRPKEPVTKKKVIAVFIETFVIALIVYFSYKSLFDEQLLQLSLYFIFSVLTFFLAYFFLRII